MGKKDNVKYVVNKGLAFSEESDLSHLETLAKEGWILSSFARGGFCYKLEKSLPQDLQYNLDCYHGKKKDYAEYLVYMVS